MSQATWHFLWQHPSWWAASIFGGTAWQQSCQFVIHFNGKFKHLPGKIPSEM